MKLTTTETIEREVEITLPAFFKTDHYSVVKVVSENQVIVVSYKYVIGISVYAECFPTSLSSKMKPENMITEEEFEQILNEVRERVYFFIQQAKEVEPELLKP